MLSRIFAVDKLTGIMRVNAKVEAADVANSLAPLMVITVELKVLALLAPSVAKADKNTAVDLAELPP